MKNMTGKEPIWMGACNQNCEKTCAKHFNVAEIRFEDTEQEKVLGRGQFGTVFKGVVKLQNNIR